ncbi:amidoligase family protein [Marivita sp. S2033]
MATNATPFPPLPVAKKSDGTDRLCGVEIEFAGPTEDQTAERIVQDFGGTISSDGQHGVTIKNTVFGDIFVELDITLRKRDDVPFLNEGLDLFRGLIPVEVVTAPLDRRQMAEFNAVCRSLRDIGAMGSRKGVLHGFGVHLNPDVVAPDDRHTFETIRAYGFLEPWLRAREGVDPTRRMMPFVGAWPNAFVSQLATTTFTDVPALMHLAADYIKSRNQSLDLLPLFKHAEPALFSKLFAETDKTSARPTFHFRLPDSRIDEPDWSLLQPWQLWRQVELVAANAPLMQDLAVGWSDHDAAWFERKSVWVDTVDHLLDTHDVKVEQCPAP